MSKEENMSKTQSEAEVAAAAKAATDDYAQKRLATLHKKGIVPNAANNASVRIFIPEGLLTKEQIEGDLNCPGSLKRLLSLKMDYVMSGDTSYRKQDGTELFGQKIPQFIEKGGKKIHFRDIPNGHPETLSPHERMLARKIIIAAETTVNGYGGYLSGVEKIKGGKKGIAVIKAAPQFEMEYLEYRHFIIDKNGPYQNESDRFFADQYLPNRDKTKTPGFPSLNEAEESIKSKSNDYIALSGGNEGKIFNKAAFLAAIKQDVMIELAAANAMAEKAGHKAHHKGVLAGVGFFSDLDANRKNSIASILTPIILQAYKEVLEQNKFPMISTVEFPLYKDDNRNNDPSAQFNQIFKGSDIIPSVKIIGANMTDVLNPKNVADSEFLSFNNAGDAFSNAGNEGILEGEEQGKTPATRGASSVEAAIGNRTDISISCTTQMNPAMLDPKNIIMLNLASGDLSASPVTSAAVVPVSAPVPEGSLVLPKVNIVDEKLVKEKIRDEIFKMKELFSASMNMPGTEDIKKWAKLNPIEMNEVITFSKGLRDLLNVVDLEEPKNPMPKAGKLPNGTVISPEIDDEIKQDWAKYEAELKVYEEKMKLKDTYQEAIVSLIVTNKTDKLFNFLSSNPNVSEYLYQNLSSLNIAGNSFANFSEEERFQRNHHSKSQYRKKEPEVGQLVRRQPTSAPAKRVIAIQVPSEVPRAEAESSCSRTPPAAGTSFSSAKASARTSAATLVGTAAPVAASPPTAAAAIVAAAKPDAAKTTIAEEIKKIESSYDIYIKFHKDLVEYFETLEENNEVLGYIKQYKDTIKLYEEGKISDTNPNFTQNLSEWVKFSNDRDQQFRADIKGLREWIGIEKIPDPYAALTAGVGSSAAIAGAGSGAASGQPITSKGAGAETGAPQPLVIGKGLAASSAVANPSKNLKKTSQDNFYNVFKEILSSERNYYLTLSSLFEETQPVKPNIFKNRIKYLKGEYKSYDGKVHTISAYLEKNREASAEFILGLEKIKKDTLDNPNLSDVQRKSEILHGLSKLYDDKFANYSEGMFDCESVMGRLNELREKNANNFFGASTEVSTCDWLALNIAPTVQRGPRHQLLLIEQIKYGMESGKSGNTEILTAVTELQNTFTNVKKGVRKINNAGKEEAKHSGDTPVSEATTHSASPPVNFSERLSITEAASAAGRNNAAPQHPIQSVTPAAAVAATTAATQQSRASMTAGINEASYHEIAEKSEQKFLERENADTNFCKNPKPTIEKSEHIYKNLNPSKSSADASFKVNWTPGGGSMERCFVKGDEPHVRITITANSTIPQIADALKANVGFGCLEMKQSNFKMCVNMIKAAKEYGIDISLTSPDCPIKFHADDIVRLKTKHPVLAEYIEPKGTGAILRTLKHN